MTLVISKSVGVEYFRNEEMLGEVLGHSNFDGREWAVGDRILFEDGTESSIEQSEGEEFYTWHDPIPSNLDDIRLALSIDDASNWTELFSRYDRSTSRDGCLTS